MDGQMDAQMDRKSQHPTGPRPLLELLPCFPLRKLQKYHLEAKVLIYQSGVEFSVTGNQNNSIRKAAFAEKAALKSDLIHFGWIGKRRKNVSVYFDAFA